MKDRLNFFRRGIIRENPLFVYALGICPALAVSTSAGTALAMGISTTIVLTASCVLASSTKRALPRSVRIPVYMLIVATFVTLVQYIMRAYMMPVYEALGIYLSLIVVNCLVYSRIETFASRNSIVSSALDALGMGLGYTLAMVIMGIIRELLGRGTIFGVAVLAGHVESVNVFTLAPGGFFTLGIIIAAVNKLTRGRRRGCDFNCAACPASRDCSIKPDKEGGAA